MRAERGSVLLLVPAGVLAVVVLAAIAVDTAHVHLVRHELQLAASAAANDAVAAGIDEAALRSGSGISLDPVRVRQVVEGSLLASGVAGELVGPPAVDVLPANQGSAEQVKVALATEVRPLFASGLPGRSDPILVRATATAFPEQR